MFQRCEWSTDTLEERRCSRKFRSRDRPAFSFALTSCGLLHLKLNSLLRVNPCVERVLDLFHLRDEVGRVDQFLRGVAAGNDDMQVRLRFADGFYLFKHA